jgi:ABC-2 type transport system permease protein
VLRNLLLKTLMDRWRALFWWSLGIVVYTLFLGALWPVMEQSREQFAAMLDVYPQELLGMFGVGDMQEMFTPAGYLVAQAFGWLVPVVFAIYAAAMGAQLIAGEEEANTMDLLLANPIPRTRVVWQKWAGLVLAMAALGLVLLAAAVATDRLFGLGIPLDRYVAVCVQATLLGLLFGSVAFAAGAMGARRGLIIGIVSAFAVAAFLVNSLGTITEWLRTARYFSPFYYYDSNRPLFEGIDWLNVTVLAAIAVAGLAVALFAFPRRDVTA